MSNERHWGGSQGWLGLGEADGINRLVLDVGVRETGESRGRVEVPVGILKSPVVSPHPAGWMLGRGLSHHLLR